MKGHVFNTDAAWYRFLRDRPELDEVNFWLPGGGGRKSLQPGEPIFFKLKKEHGHAIAGFGLFQRWTLLPVWLAWEAFELGNGTATLEELRRRVAHYRHVPPDALGQASIGCLLVSAPVFFPEELWVPGPVDWKDAIVVEKGYELLEGEGRRIWRDCLERVPRYLEGEATSESVPATKGLVDRYGKPVLVRPRLGQGGFRIGVMEAYGKACAVTAEHSLPVLEAAHIRSYQHEGPHEISNGLLLRADLHKLFDAGYVTVTEDLHFEVSPRLREDYQNGKTYYALQGKSLLLPNNLLDRPSREQLRWHNEHVFARSG
jgi:putative restriction endonuclease